LKFENLLESVQLSKPAVKLYKKLVLRVWNDEVKHLQTKRRAYEKKQFFQRSDIELSTLKDSVIELNNTTENKQQVVDHAFNFLGSISLVWQSANIDSQVKMQGLVFPNGIGFDLEAKSFWNRHIKPYLQIT
jgi:hypothetical protein